MSETLERTREVALTLAEVAVNLKQAKTDGRPEWARLTVTLSGTLSKQRCSVFSAVLLESLIPDGSLLHASSNHTPTSPVPSITYRTQGKSTPRGKKSEAVPELGPRASLASE